MASSDTIKEMQLVLASASPRRAELLTAAGFTFDVAPADVDETPRPAEPPATYALRVARDKALACRRSGSADDAWILAADTVVVVDGQILGKPRERRGCAPDAATAVGRRSRGADRGRRAARRVARRSEVVTTRVRFTAAQPG